MTINFNSFDDYLSYKIPQIEKTIKRLNLSYWDTLVEPFRENKKKYLNAQQQFAQCFQNPSEFEFIKYLKKKDHLSDHQQIYIRQLEKFYLEFSIQGELEEEITRQSTSLENHIHKKYLKRNKFLAILRNSDNLYDRNVAWKKLSKCGIDAISVLKNLVETRNKASQLLGFLSYYEFALYCQDINPDWLSTQLNKSQRKDESQFNITKKKIDDSARILFKKNNGRIAPWMYHDPFFQESLQSSSQSLFFDSTEKIIDAVHQYFNKIGLNADDIIENSELSINKYQFPVSLCMDLDRNGDIRIMANLFNNQKSLENLLHEVGHGVYYKYIDKTLPFLLREECHPFINEAFAGFFGDLAYNPNWLRHFNLISEDVAGKLLHRFKEDELEASILFRRFSQVVIRFEQEMYHNPDQNLSRLWWNLVQQYQHISLPPDYDASEYPIYTSQPHLLISPVYYQNYYLGNLFKSKLKSYLKNNFFLNQKKDDYYLRLEFGDFLISTFFQHGRSKDWKEIAHFIF